MSYTLNKVYTDHPLMDEICYYCKLILKDIVIKNDILANNCETENSIIYADIYSIRHDKGFVSFESFPFTVELLMNLGYSYAEANNIVDNRYSVPEDQREALAISANEYFVEHFEEENNYYRTLIGLPPYDSGDEYIITMDKVRVPEDYIYEVDYSLPLHLQSKKLINALYKEGIIDELRETYKGSNYSYILFLGDRSIDLYVARNANKWDILYIPDVYYEIKDRFTEFYKINQENYLKRSYQEFFSMSGQYYDQSMILIVLCQTFADMIVDIPEAYIRRDIFDARSCEYFLDSYGVQFFNKIPLKYQIRIVKNINNLIRYKSSNKNTYDILDIFGIPNTRIYRYWLYKNRDKYDERDEYNLKFLATDLGESYDKYIYDNKYFYDYDEFVKQDKYWDSINDHDALKEEIVEQDFTISPTKYMSVEYQVPLEEFNKQMSYFLGLIFDSKSIIDDITISVVSIDETALFKLSDLFLYLVILTNSFNRTSFDNDYTKTRFIDSYDGSDEFDIDESKYDWLVDKLPEIFANKTGRVEAFNTEADLDNLVDMLTRRISHNRFGANEEENGIPYVGDEYIEKAIKWINEIDFKSYQNPAKEYTNTKELVDIYESNMKLLDNLDYLLKIVEGEDDKKILCYIYQELFTKKFDKDFYKITNKDGSIYYANDLIDLLKYKDITLYNSLISIISESNTDSRYTLISNVMNDIITTLEYYIKSDKLEYIYSFTSIESFSSIIYYMYLMLNFFKSYKVYFLDPYVTYTYSENKAYNGSKAHDKVNEYTICNDRNDRAYASDLHIALNIEKTATDEYYYDENKSYLDTRLDERLNYQYESVDIYSYYEFDPGLDYNFDGLSASRGEDLDFFELDGFYADIYDDKYITVNGGNSIQGLADLSEFNGGYSKEEYTTYANIDCGYAYDPADFELDCFSVTNFIFNIDAGGASSKVFYSPAMYTYIEKSTIYSDIIISDRYEARVITRLIKGDDGTYHEETFYDKIIILDDGLYLSGSAYVNNNEYDATIQNTLTFDNKLTSTVNRIQEDIRVASDINALIERIDKIRDEVLYPMEKVNDIIGTDSDANIFINNINTVVNEILLSTKEELDKLDPFTWETLMEG